MSHAWSCLSDAVQRGTVRGLDKNTVHWQPRYHRFNPVRPVALRLRLSADLPLSASVILAAARTSSNVSPETDSQLKLGEKTCINGADRCVTYVTEV